MPYKDSSDRLQDLVMLVDACESAAYKAGAAAHFDQPVEALREALDVLRAHHRVLLAALSSVCADAALPPVYRPYQTPPTGGV